MLELRDLPHTLDLDHRDPQRIFAQWPADDGPEHVIVRINTYALSNYDGEKFSIDIEKIKAALKRHRDLIQDLARRKNRQGGSVTLDIGDFPARS